LRQQLGIKAPYPGFVAPALAADTRKVPSGPQWLHEVKFDGYRVQVHLHVEAIKVFTRRGHDWTGRFRKIADDAWRLSAKSAIVDGEVIVPGAGGCPISRSCRKSFARRLRRSASSCMRSTCFITTAVTSVASP
jgi:ATP-dependent DNA ligase